MEDPELEWKIQEYSSSEESSKVSWILNKGLSLGKKVVITGILISSAPLVLPPLVFFSAFGLASSVPFGFFLASYACTEKLMSKLLSTPTPPIIWEYGTDEEETIGNGEDGVGFGGGIDMVEGYEEDDEDMMEEKEQSLIEIDMAIEGMGEEAEMEESRGEQPVEEMGGVVVVVGGDEGNGSNVEVKEPIGLTRAVDGDSGGVEKVIDIEGNKLARETMGLQEINRDEGNVVNEQWAKKMRGLADKRDEKPVIDKKAMLQGGRTDDNIAREKENVIRSNVDSREIADESGFDLFDDINAAGEQYSHSVHETPKENQHSSRNIGEGGADFVERSVSAGVPKSRHAVIFSEKNITMPSDKNVAEEGNYEGGSNLEEEELINDTKDGIEIRIELVEK